jgi:hypothetical protein
MFNSVFVSTKQPHLKWQKPSMDSVQTTMKYFYFISRFVRGLEEKLELLTFRTAQEPA